MDKLVTIAENINTLSWYVELASKATTEREKVFASKHGGQLVDKINEQLKKINEALVSVNIKPLSTSE